MVVSLLLAKEIAYILLFLSITSVPTVEITTPTYHATIKRVTVVLRIILMVTHASP